MTAESRTQYSALEMYFPRNASEVRYLAGHIVFEDMAKRWAQNPDYSLVRDVEDQINWLLDEGHGIVPRDLVGQLTPGEQVN